MNWTNVMTMIDPKLIIVVVACWILGYILKQTPRVPDWSIIYIVTVVAAVFASLLIGFSAVSVLQGILCGAVAVYGNQLLKQAKKVNGDDEQ
nr:phage holin family protein [Paenibacillus tyrfis]